MATSYENFQAEPTDPEKLEEARREAAMTEQAARDSQPPPYAFGAPVSAPGAVMCSAAPGQPQPAGPVPQMVVLAKPEKQVKPETIQRRRRVAFVCGVVELGTALSLFILGIVLVRQDVEGKSFSFQGFLVPALTLATAVLSLLAGVKGYKGCLIGGMIMAIITAVVSGACFILSTVMCGIYSTEAEYDYMYGVSHYRTLSIIFGIAILIHLVVIVTCIVQSGFACAQLCRCCHTQDPMNGARFAYIAQPGQHGQLVYGGQAMPVLDLGRQNIPPPVQLLTHPA